MGNGNSVPSNINRQTGLMQEIHGVATELIEQYNSKYLDPQFCTRVALIYNDRLMNYRKHELDGVTATLGLAVDNPKIKQNLCAAIVKHYTDRLNLISAIQHSLDYCSNRIFALTTGPRCDGNPEIFDQAECVNTGGRWAAKIIPPERDVAENNEWYQYLEHMQEIYLRSLAQLLDILKQLKKFDQDINEERLRVMGEEVKGLIDNMNGTCYQMYKLMLTKPTFTDEELRLQKESDNLNTQEAAARLAALRAAKGLPPVSSK